MFITLFKKQVMTIYSAKCIWAGLHICEICSFGKDAITIYEVVIFFRGYYSVITGYFCFVIVSGGSLSDQSEIYIKYTKHLQACCECACRCVRCYNLFFVQKTMYIWAAKWTIQVYKFLRFLCTVNIFSVLKRCALFLKYCIFL